MVDEASRLVATRRDAASTIRRLTGRTQKERLENSVFFLTGLSSAMYCVPS